MDKETAQRLYSELDRVAEKLEQAHLDLHYWQGEEGIRGIRESLTNLCVRIALLQEKLP
jgi:hypothetical protein